MTPTLSSPPLDALGLRAEFPILSEQIHGRDLVYLDNAASTQKPLAVLAAMDRFHRSQNANVHRGIHELSNRATEAYDGARLRVASYLGIEDPAELIWTRGTTEAINLVAWSWGSANLREGDEILLTLMEHHSNLVPWQILAGRTGAKLRFIGLDDEQRLDLSNLDDLLTERTRIVSVTHVSNALGTINPVREIAERARAVGAVTLVDGAQSAPHLEVDVASLGCDFFAFSGHKMCGPTGIGGLWGRRAAGGDAALPRRRGHDRRGGAGALHLRAAPHRFEAGTPHIAGAVGLGAAAEYLAGVGP
jgi:cysteine desulfurase / selenocysteine lyase